MDRAVLLNAPGEPARVEEVALDEPGANEVVVRMLAVGVCHTDLHVKETGGWGMPFPIALGHEGCGVVESTGERVVIAWRSPCGECPACGRGAPRLCRTPLRAKRRMRRAADGARVTPALLAGCFADRVVVHAGQAIPVPTELPPEQACLLGCAVATGVCSVLRTASVYPGARVGVIGCGAVGLSVIQGARIAGASEIHAVDLDERKLEAARQFGATHTGAGKRLDFVFDVVGRPETVALGLRMLGHAGTLVYIGLPLPDSEAVLPLQYVFDRRVRILVSHGGDHVPSDDFPMLAQLALDGKLDLAGMVSKTIALEDVPRAFDDMRAGDVIRSVIVL